MAGESQAAPSSEPDPTVLTTEALQREIKALKDLLDMRIDGLGRLVDAHISKLDQQFILVERQRVEQKQDTKAAVDAALTAQKEAVKEQTNASDRAIAKSEASTSKQLEQLGATFGAAIQGLTVLLADVKERVGRIESVKVGGSEARAAMYALVGFVISLLVIGGILAGAGVFGK